jgi:bacterial/archaeal transporter family-2 protein
MAIFSNNYFFMFLALATGVSMSTQAAVNTKLATYVESPLLAAFISFATGALVLFICLLLSGTPLGDLVKATNAPLFAWIGGALGVFFVMVMILAVPRIGVALSFSLAVAGQMLTALVIDHFGLYGVAERSISWPRLLGALLVMAGVIIIRRS